MDSDLDMSSSGSSSSMEELIEAQLQWRDYDQGVSLRDCSSNHHDDYGDRTEDDDDGSSDDGGDDEEEEVLADSSDGGDEDGGDDDGIDEKETEGREKEDSGTGSDEDESIEIQNGGTLEDHAKSTSTTSSQPPTISTALRETATVANSGATEAVVKAEIKSPVPAARSAAAVKGPRNGVGRGQFRQARNGVGAAGGTDPNKKGKGRGGSSIAVVNDGIPYIPYPSKARLPTSSIPPSSTNRPKQKVWVIFGATGHLGRSICRAVLEHGDNITAVGRDTDGLAMMQGWHTRCQGLVCDIRVRGTVEEVIEKSKKHWGRIDVITNCTGYGIIGSCEDQDDDEIQDQFDTNLIGLINIIQLTLPYFRERRSGRYIIFSSICGLIGVPGLGPYCASKFAIEGLVESLMYEVSQFNIKATLIEPTLSRRDAPDELPTDPNSTGAPTPPLWGHFLVKLPTAPYEVSTSPAQHALRMLNWMTNNQPTSAVRIAEVTWELAHCGHPPLRLLLGSHAVDTTRDRLRAVIEEMEEWRALSLVGEQEEERSGGDKGGEKGKGKRAGEGGDDEGGSGVDDMDVDGEGGGEDDEDEDSDRDGMDVDEEGED